MSSATRAPSGYGRLELLRLWLGYQRYAFLLWLICVVLLVVPLYLVPSWWWLWVWPVAYLLLKFGNMGFVIYRRWPRKLRATMVADKRIRRGSFSPVAVKQYCGDPCFRLVADEILARAGEPASSRKKIIAEFTRQRRDQPDVVVLVDRARGVKITVDGREVSQGDIEGSINQGA